MKRKRLIAPLGRVFAACKPTDVGLGNAGLLRQIDLFCAREKRPQGLRAAVICHLLSEPMSSSIACQVACVAKRHKPRKAQGMSAPRTKRGATDRALDPILARALDRLRGEIAREGLSQPELARRTGLSQGHISRALGGTPEVSFFVLAKIALAIPVSLDWLVAAAPQPRFIDESETAADSSRRPSDPGNTRPRTASQK